MGKHPTQSRPAKSIQLAALFSIGLLVCGHPAQADTPQSAAQELHAMDCQWWGYVAAFTYNGYEILEAENLVDPIQTLKAELDYDGYHLYSAGRAMLDEVFDKIDAGEPAWVARDNVTKMCHDFPAAAVAPKNVFAPMLGETL